MSTVGPEASYAVRQSFAGQAADITEVPRKTLNMQNTGICNLASSDLLERPQRHSAALRDHRPRALSRLQSIQNELENGF